MSWVYYITHALAFFLGGVALWLIDLAMFRWKRKRGL